MSSPDTNKLKTKELKVKIDEISTKISEMGKENKTEIEIEQFFFENDSEFYGRYPYLIKKLIKGGPLEFLDIMIQNLEKIENSEQTKASVELQLGEELAQKFLYPKVNQSQDSVDNNN